MPSRAGKAAACGVHFSLARRSGTVWPNTLRRGIRRHRATATGEHGAHRHAGAERTSCRHQNASDAGVVDAARPEGPQQAGS
ncbi:hypothetical protein ACI2I2_20035 [Scandinavium sp. NPDC088450]|uniref:hypothetical protein n=1 Tax=Scandinavium sp. NPDC088450 TaxID=3364514 RepID=UPI00384D39BE